MGVIISAFWPHFSKLSQNLWRTLYNVDEIDGWSDFFLSAALLKTFSLFLNIFWCAPFGYLYFLSFQSLNEPGLGAVINSGMALTPFSSRIGQGSNPRPAKREPSALPIDHSFRLTFFLYFHLVLYVQSILPFFLFFLVEIKKRLKIEVWMHLASSYLLDQ